MGERISRLGAHLTTTYVIIVRKCCFVQDSQTGYGLQNNSQSGNIYIERVCVKNAFTKPSIYVECASYDSSHFKFDCSGVQTLLTLNFNFINENARLSPE